MIVSAHKGQNRCTWWWNTKMQTRWHCECKWDASHCLHSSSVHTGPSSGVISTVEVLRCGRVCLRIQRVHIPIIETPTVSVYTDREKSYRSRWPPLFTLGLLGVQLFGFRLSWTCPSSCWTKPRWSSLKITATQELMSSHLPAPQLKDQMVMWERGYVSLLTVSTTDRDCGEQ